MNRRTVDRPPPPAWEQLASWVAVVETGSVSAAARRLALSQAGVSQHIRQLESTLDTALLDRSTRPARPTPSGQRLYEQALELLRRADEMAESVRSLSRAKHAVVRIGCVDSFAATIGPHLVRGLLGQMHKVRLFSGLTPGLNQQFIERQLDLLVTTRELGTESGIASVRLITEQYCVALPASLPEPRACSLAELSRSLPFMNYSLRSTIGGQIDAYLRGTDPQIERNFEFDATDPLLSLVCAGLGFALTTPLCLWQSRHHAAALRLMPLSAFRQGGRPYPPMARSFWLTHRSGELGRLPGDVIDLIGVAGRELRREIVTTLGLDEAALQIGAQAREP